MPSSWQQRGWNSTPQERCSGVRDRSSGHTRAFRSGPTELACPLFLASRESVGVASRTRCVRDCLSSETMRLASTRCRSLPSGRAESSRELCPTRLPCRLRPRPARESRSIPRAARLWLDEHHR
jgi:hypothetical protein